MVSLRPGVGRIVLPCAPKEGLDSTLGMDNGLLSGVMTVASALVRLPGSWIIYKEGASYGSAFSSCANFSKQLHFSGLSFLICTMELIINTLLSQMQI